MGQMNTFTVTVIPCGQEDASKNFQDEQPHELKLTGGTNDLRIVIYNQLVEDVWHQIFKQHLGPTET